MAGNYKVKDEKVTNTSISAISSAQNYKDAQVLVIDGMGVGSVSSLAQKSFRLI